MTDWPTRAARRMWLWMGTLALFVLSPLIAFGPSEVPMRNYVPALVLYVLLLTGAWFLSRRVLLRRSALGAIIMVGLCALGGVVTLSIAAAGGEREPGFLMACGLQAVQLVFASRALVALWRAKDVIEADREQTA